MSGGRGGPERGERARAGRGTCDVRTRICAAFRPDGTRASGRSRSGGRTASVPTIERYGTKDCRDTRVEVRAGYRLPPNSGPGPIAKINLYRGRELCTAASGVRDRVASESVRHEYLMSR